MVVQMYDHKPIMVIETGVVNVLVKEQTVLTNIKSSQGTIIPLSLKIFLTPDSPPSVLMTSLFNEASPECYSNDF